MRSAVRPPSNLSGVSHTSRRLALTLLAGMLALPLWTPAATATGAIETGPSAAAPTRQPVGGPLLAGRGVVVARGAPALPRDITGRGWLVADMDTGAVLGARDPHGRYLPASTLKTLTALTLLPKLTDHRRLVRASPDDCNIDGTRVGLVPTGRYPVEMLFQCMLMMSGNDCAGALAEANGGVPQTVAEMNAVARRLQAGDTHAATPSGLDGRGQSTSAYDLALILRQVLAVPDFRRYNTTRISSVPPQSSKYGRIQFANDNKLLYNYPGVLAAKNGYTDAARHTFVAAVTRGNRRLLITLLHGEQRPIPIWQQVARLAEWGARVPASASVGQLVQPVDPDAPAAEPAPTPTEVRPAGAGASGSGEGRDRLPLVPIGLAAAGTVAAVGAFAWAVRHRPAPARRSSGYRG
jgi:D-alanyl-D-alanine carboxypeptidase (penicillin-binding protein 5/6)